jgi:anaerobic magnesium-protoporphyrin IX monomethyl ester cyclase
MTDILFTHSYFLKFDSKEARAMMPYPPLATMYAAALTRQQGYTVALADSMLAEDEKHLLPYLTAYQPRVVVIYDDDFNYLTKMCLSRMREAAFAMTRIAKKFGCLVVVHGSDPVDHLETYFAHGADYVLCGEAEDTLVELLALVFGNTGSRVSIRGLAYRDEGAIVRTAERRPRTDLDALPFPAWDLIDVERYRTVWRANHGYFSLNMVTTRGCPFHCNWCAKPIYGQVYNSRSPANVVSEMLWVKEHLRPDHIWFCDDIFGLKPGWIESFAETVVGSDAVIPFKCLGRVDLLLKEGTVSALKRAGCDTIWVGAESGAQNILDAMEKGTTVAQIYEASRRIKEAGIHLAFFLQYGYPGETRGDIDKTLQMLKDCMPDEIGVSVSYPLPGTPFYERVRSQLGSKQNWTESGDLDLMYRGTYSPDFYRALHTMTHKLFRVWQSRGILRQRLRRPWSASRRDARRIIAGAYHFMTLPAIERKLNFLEAHS